MGDFSFTVGRYSRSNARSVMGTTVETSDSFTSSTTAAFVEDASGDITVGAGAIVRATCSEDAWVAFGGRTATVGNDFKMLAGNEYEWEISPGDEGKISVIDVA